MDKLRREISNMGFTRQEVEEIAREIYDNDTKFRKQGRHGGGHGQTH